MSKKNSKPGAPVVGVAVVDESTLKRIARFGGGEPVPVAELPRYVREMMGLVDDDEDEES